MSPPQLLRMALDAFMVLVSLLIAQAGRVLWWHFVESTENPQGLSKTLFEPWSGPSIALVVVTCVTIFWVNGFYNYGHTYYRRHKLLAITRAIALAYIIVGTISFLFPQAIAISRSVLLLAAGSTWAFLVGSRLWSELWRRIISIEEATDTTTGGFQSPRKRTVLVIGGAGYIGSALLPKLLEQGRRVRVLDLMMYGTEPIEAVFDHPRLELVKGDFRQVDVVVKAMRGVDEVVHLGGLVGDPACAYDEELTIDVNLAATRMVAEVARGNGIGRFIFAGSCSVYGASDGVLDERSKLIPLSLYARTKIASEKVLLRLADDTFQPVIARFATVYGISGRTRFDLVVNLLTAKALLEGQITIFGGDQWRPFLHVDDAALAISLLLEEPIPNSAEFRIFNAGSTDENYTILQVGELVHKHVPEATLLSSSGVDGDRRNYRVSFDKIRRAVGFAPRWTVEDGIKQVLAQIRAEQILSYNEPRFSNIKFLSENGKFHLARPQLRWAHELLEDRAEWQAPETYAS
jgi:nucleoside-diphosphate-sugar epimerase